MTAPLALIALAALQSPLAQDTSRHVTWSGFVDAYFAYDTDRPGSFDRAFTTQAARHDEFNINLAYLAVSLASERTRGRLAFQAGTSVQVNYATEPTIGSVSGPSLSRHIQEATVGARVARGLWVDGGIYLSYIGLEGWISRDNPTYTRSLVADFTPYYLSGARLTWQPSGPVTLQLHVMNGWQIISENNRAKSVGSRVDWQLSSAVTLAYANFVGNEQPDSLPSKTRVFNQIMAHASLPGGWVLQGEVDYGRQAGLDWSGFTVVGRKAVTRSAALVGRLEGYSDPDQVIVLTGTSAGFSGRGGSFGMDIDGGGGLLWRTEVRALHTSVPLFPRGGNARASRDDVLLVTSLALTL